MSNVLVHIKYGAHQRFYRTRGAEIMYVYKEIIKRLVRPLCVKNWLIILRRIAHFYSRQCRPAVKRAVINQ